MTEVDMNKIVAKRFPRNAVRAGAIAIGVLAAVPLVGQGMAHADTQVRLPNQTVTKKLADGTALTITRTNERARINPSMGGTPLHRNAWVSGRYDVKASDKKAKLGIASGYIVGCQLTLGGNSTTKGGAKPGTGDYDVPISATAETGASVTLGPGQAANYTINDVEGKDDFGAESHGAAVKFAGSGAVAYTNETMMINGCAGYAQARSYAKVQVMTDHTTQVVYLYGKPFSLG
ncbi:MspA family porin [Gordonia sp. SL306]|uniref:MspA family porin n=1 Tax=Gordonia sp. SL306 TaxID=2995145 RepID=UPI00226F22E1|nr:MspA family porin [Gordonia sp. SL306]WAC54636.1 MspA family porin [Gordonia sp. SL306]